jgi:adenine-specific DNA-methyltransferase
MSKKQQRGQFFTTNKIVQDVMHSLITKSSGKILEPSAGAGDLLLRLEKNNSYKIDAVELDKTLNKNCKTKIVYQDFFVYANSKENSYDIIFGNPPYVAWKSLEESTKLSAKDVKANYSDKTNLYHLFIDRCIDLLNKSGELIFIVPKEWLYTSSAITLRSKILEQGSLTHIIDCGEEKLFADADVPALLIFKFVKGFKSNNVLFAQSLDDANKNNYTSKNLINKNGRYLLLSDSLIKQVKDWGVFSDNFSVKVGIVSGADEIFKVGNRKNLEKQGIKSYLTTKGAENFIDCNHIDEESKIPKNIFSELSKYKDRLMSRKINKFDENNWWKYGAIRNKNYMESLDERFYAFAKTRLEKPFFSHSEKFYGGGILGIFKHGDVSIDNAITILNSKIYREILESMFLTSGNKVSLQPATLEDAPFPKNNKQAKDFIKKYKL